MEVHKNEDKSIALSFGFGYTLDSFFSWKAFVSIA